MDFIRKEDIQALKQWMDEASRPVVVGHTHPDGDALGSTAAMALYLREKAGKDAVCIFSDSPALHLRFILPEQVPYLFLDVQPEETIARIREADLIILLDCNGFCRTEGLETALEQSQARKVLIDHHLNPQTQQFGLVFSTPNISSASELLYWILRSLANAWDDKSAAIGTALLAGMTTDTNNFANSVYPSTFQMASELIASGVDRDALLQQIYNSYRENRVRLMGYMQYEGLHILPEGGAFMILTQDILHRFDLQEGESEGLVNVPLAIRDVRMSVLLKQETDHFRVSIRSRKGTSAQQCAQRYFHGGGHENAAGGKLLIGEDISRAEDAAAFVERTLKTFLA